MNRLPFVLCLSISCLAAAMASFALLKNGPDDARMDVEKEEELRELHVLVASLGEKIEALESRQVAPKKSTWSPRKRSPKKEVASRGEPTDLQGQLAALTERLATLEDEETIARLAQSGEQQVVQKELNSALAQIGDPDAEPEDRLEALASLRGLRKKNWPLFAETMKENELEERDLVMPMLELAQDTTLEPEFRAEVLHSLDSKVPELRQPLLDMLSFEDSPEVREGSMNALMYQLGDSGVRDAIRQASQEDRHESVQATAQEYLPKVEYFDRRAVEAERARASRTATGGATSGGTTGDRDAGEGK